MEFVVIGAKFRSVPYVSMLTGVQIIAVITPYMVNKDEGNLKSSVFFIWGGLCTAAFVWAYLFIPETKVCLFRSKSRFISNCTLRVFRSSKLIR